MRADIVPGAVFPDYELTDHTKTRRKLSELQGTDPMILILSRGQFCPKDHQQHLELAALYPKIAVAPLIYRVEDNRLYLIAEGRLGPRSFPAGREDYPGNHERGDGERGRYPAQRQAAVGPGLGQGVAESGTERPGQDIRAPKKRARRDLPRREAA